MKIFKKHIKIPIKEKNPQVAYIYTYVLLNVCACVCVVLGSDPGSTALSQSSDPTIKSSFKRSNYILKKLNEIIKIMLAGR